MTRYRVRDSARLRAGPGLRYAVLTTLPAGAVVQADDRHAWVPVMVSGDPPALGFVAAELLESVPDAPAERDGA